MTCQYSRFVRLRRNWPGILRAILSRANRKGLRTANPEEPPHLIFLMNQEIEKDLADVVNGGRLLQAIARTRAISSLIAEPIAPDLGAMGPPDLIADFRARASTVYHPVSTCRMGKAAGESVVDTSLRVHGVERLRVVDASVFPTVTSANTHAPTVMVAQKAADLVLQGRIT